MHQALGCGIKATCGHITRPHRTPSPHPTSRPKQPFTPPSSHPEKRHSHLASPQLTRLCPTHLSSLLRSSPPLSAPSWRHLPTRAPYQDRCPPQHPPLTTAFPRSCKHVDNRIVKTTPCSYDVSPLPRVCMYPGSGGSMQHASRR